jgi:hypothetical protein
VIRRRWVVLGLVLALAGIGAGVLVSLWSGSGARELPLSVAVNRFRPGRPVSHDGAMRPAQGVYRYAGTGSEHLSVPPKSQSEGPVMPGTITYVAHGCWMFRLDYNNRHWQENTYCPRGGALLEPIQAGWYDWDFVVFSEQDTETFKCGNKTIGIPAERRTGVRLAFHCLGHNDHLATGPVTLTGWVEYLGRGQVDIKGSHVDAVHVRQVSLLSGGQHGENKSDTWYETTSGLPLAGTWTSSVQTPTPIGTSTLTASGTFVLTDLRPQT